MVYPSSFKVEDEWCLEICRSGRDETYQVSCDVCLQNKNCPFQNTNSAPVHWKNKCFGFSKNSLRFIYILILQVTENQIQTGYTVKGMIRSCPWTSAGASSSLKSSRTWLSFSGSALAFLLFWFRSQVSLSHGSKLL